MRFLARLLAYVAALLLSGIALGGIAAAVLYFEFEKELPDAEALREVRLQVPLRVYTADGLLIGEYGEQRREPVTYDEIPERVIQAFLAAEDDRFFEHPGVDYRGLLRAGIDLIRTGERRQGGSTITMQVARNFFLSPEKTYTRKIKEILLAMKIEREMSKEEILALYLNKIYLGQRAYGVAAAARVYYGKALAELTLAETAMIAGLPKAPSRYNPVANPDRAVIRRNYVLGRMREVGFITDEVLAENIRAPVTAHAYRPDIQLEAGYVAEMARAWMVERYGDEEAYSGGYHVYTTIDSRHQVAARKGVRMALDAYDRRHGYRGPEGRLEPVAGAGVAVPEDAGRVGELLPAVVTAVGDKTASLALDDGSSLELDWAGISWASPYVSENRRGKKPGKAADVVSVGDVVRVVQESNAEGGPSWRLAQIPAVQGALVSLDPRSGAVLALVGGYDYFHSKFNRAVQAKRQPGSGFKPFIYSAALDAGYTPATLVNDTPVVIQDPSLPAGFWKPANYGHKFHGPTPLRQGLAKSRNLISIRVLRSIGIDRVLEYLDRFGLDASRFTPGLSLALGVGEVTPWEMARAYGVFANGGFLVEPYVVARIEQEGEGEIYRSQPLAVCETCELSLSDEPMMRDTAPRTLTAENRFLMYSMMRDVVQAGTATRAKVLGRKDLAGKTGTTNDYRDAWFNGYTESLVAVIWVGHDDFTPLGRGEAGGKAALPGWITYMREALVDVRETLPEPPAGIVVQQTGNRSEYFDSTVQADFVPDPVAPADAEVARPEDELF
jgi:penicillin-binding protein 1A